MPDSTGQLPKAERDFGTGSQELRAV